MMILFSLLVIAVGMSGQAFFSGIETGMISIRRMRLRHFVRRGSRRAEILEYFLENTDRLLGTTLVGTNVCVVLVSITAAELVAELIGQWGEVVSTAVMSLLVLVFCEYLPKNWFQRRPLSRCYRFADALRAADRILRPFAFVVVGLTRLLVPGPAKSFSTPLPFVTKEDLKTLAREGEEDGVLSSKERAMIHRVMELSGKNAARITVPLEKMVTVDSTTSIADFCQKARESQRTRMPIYDANKESYVGIINVFDILRASAVDSTQTVMQFARPPLFVPEDMPVDDIFPRLRRFRQPMGLVVDEEGAVTGLVTTEDILEEIVGQL
jgi:putative hemolysin